MSLSAKVLIVEDDAELSALYQAYLIHEGYEVTTVTTGGQALTELMKMKPDIVLLDVMLPDGSGFDVCKRIKQSRRGPMTSVILVTALNSSESRTQAFNADADEFLSKPAYREELVARVNSAMRLRTAIREQHRTRLDLEVEKRERIRQLFGRYVSHALVDNLLEHPPKEWPKLLSRKDRVTSTIMFTDVRGFTSLAETLEPEQVVGFLNHHFSMLTQRVHEHGGTVLNMTGDGLLIAFGTPVPLENSQVSALRCALQMHQDFNQELRQTSVDAIRDVGLGIGIHSGPVIVGNVGSESYMAYTVIGDAVNVAARAQSMARKACTVITESIHAHIASVVACPIKRLTDQTIRGRSQMLALYELDMSTAPRS